MRFRFLLVALLPAVFAATALAAPVGSTFTFQGFLQKNSLQHSGPADFEFRLFDAATGGAQVGVTLSRLAEPVTLGLFTVSLDFGAVFDGNARWLAVSVKTAGDGSFTTLGTRVEVHPTPYALYAPGAGLALPYAGSVANTGQTSTIDALDHQSVIGITNTATTGMSHALVGITESSWHNAAGVVGVGAATSGLTSGVQGYATASAQGTGVVGIGQATGGYFRGEGFGATGLVAAAGPLGQAVLAEGGGNGYGLRANSSFGSAILASASGGAIAADAVHTAGGIAVRGQSTNAGGTGGWFQGGPGGIAIKAEGLAQVKTLQILGGADLAERFPVRGPVEPGTVLVIDPSEPGRLMVSNAFESRNVAGVVSGANSLNAGIELSDGEDLAGTAPVALSGRVWVKADARERPIRTGDLLVTANLAGHCAALADERIAPGRVLGKAMSSLEHGTGLVLVLVSLR